MNSTVIPEMAVLSLRRLNMFYLLLCIEYRDLILNLLKQQTKSNLTIAARKQVHFNPPLHGQAAPMFRVF